MTGRHESRRLTLTIIAALCALTTRAPAATPAATMHHAAAQPGASSKAGAIRQEAVIAASPERVYAALLDSTQFGAVTGMHAVIEPTVGAAFHNFNGMIEGRNLELVPGQRIVQAWRVYDWPAGVYSIVRFVL